MAPTPQTPQGDPPEVPPATPGTPTEPPAEAPPCVHGYGLAANADAAGLEAVSLYLGPHLAGGHTLPPVVRSQAWLAAAKQEIADGIA